MKTKILIVDDLRENIKALTLLIESDQVPGKVGQEVEILSAQTPDEALSLLIDHEFGLALLDVQMPTMTGFELARLIRGIERGKHLPIIFVTAHASESKLIIEGYDSGAVDVLFKPLDPHIVRNKVRVFVRLDQQSRQLAAQVAEMARLKQEAEAANVAKSRFLANMSHEIRTPLGAVLGFADVLSQGDLSADERSESIASISRNGKLLLRIIDDILDLSRIEAQRLEFERVPFDLADLMKDLEATLLNRAVDKGITLEMAAAEYPGENFSGRFISDPLRLKQILLNMIGNAIKFTRVGSVKVITRVRSAGSGKGAGYELCFTIVDTGVGLSVDEANRLFEPFAQADSSTRRKFGGTGLGLVISKQLARSLGGDVVLKASESGQGSTFEVTIQAPSTLEQDERSAARSAASRDPALKSLEGKNILVVDDVIDNRILIERYLRPEGVHIEQASGGAEALKLVGKTDWDAVLMDIQMPVMDGYETTSKLRALGFKKPIIALTAHAMREELERCLKAGCNMTLTKPVAKGELIARLCEALRPSSAST